MIINYYIIYLNSETIFPSVQKTAKTVKPLCKNKANEPRSVKRIPMTKHIANPFIRVDQLKVVPSDI